MERNRKPRVLVVDDHEDNIELLRARLEARGYEVYGANDGQAALEQVQRVCPDLILLDMMMPGRSGIEVLEDLRADPELQEVPVVMLTARAQAADREAAERAGADRFLSKPFSPAELSRLVEELLGRGR